MTDVRTSQVLAAASRIWLGHQRAFMPRRAPVRPGEADRDPIRQAQPGRWGTPRGGLRDYSYAVSRGQVHHRRPLIAQLSAPGAHTVLRANSGGG
jgi:hypothetical protein